VALAPLIAETLARHRADSLLVGQAHRPLKPLEYPKQRGVGIFARKLGGRAIGRLAGEPCSPGANSDRGGARPLTHQLHEPPVGIERFHCAILSAGAFDYGNGSVEATCRAW